MKNYMKNYMKNNKDGFTLIELLVVIAIIGILATSAFTIFARAQAKARDAKRQADINNIASAMTIYASNNGGNYPTAAAQFATYLSKTPTPPTKDSGANNKYFVYSDNTKKAFLVTACGMNTGTPNPVYGGRVDQITLDCSGVNPAVTASVNGGVVGAVTMTFSY